MDIEKLIGVTQYISIDINGEDLNITFRCYPENNVTEDMDGNTSLNQTLFDSLIDWNLYYHGKVMPVTLSNIGKLPIEIRYLIMSTISYTNKAYLDVVIHNTTTNYRLQDNPSQVIEPVFDDHGNRITDKIKIEEILQKEV